MALPLWAAASASNRSPSRISWPLTKTFSMPKDFSCFFVEDGHVGVIPFPEIAALPQLEAIRRSAGHPADGLFHGIARAQRRVPKEFWEAVVNGGILNAVLLHPCIGHEQAQIVFLKGVNDLLRGVGAHVDPALKVGLPAKPQVHFQIAEAPLLSQLMNGLALVLLVAGADVGHLDVAEIEAQQQDGGPHQQAELQPVQRLTALLFAHALIPCGQNDRDDGYALRFVVNIELDLNAFPAHLPEDT